MKSKDKALLIVLGLIVVVAFVGGQWHNGFKEFTTAKWINYTENSRQAIVQNFLDKTVVPGMTEEMLLEYLGKPDHVSDTEQSYYLGEPKFLFLNTGGEEEYLVFLFDEDGIITEAEIRPASAMTDTQTSDGQGDDAA